MQNLYPLFERNRILRKELLSSLRDYSFAHACLEYLEYGDGILRGCDIHIEEKKITVTPGVVKWGSHIFLMTQEESVGYAPSDRTITVRLHLQKEQAADFVIYRMELVLDYDAGLPNHDIGSTETEFELCRYRLQEGARLRADYKDFEDMGTQYDTVNHIRAAWGCLHGNSISPAITRRFAQEILKEENRRPEDTAFAYLCLSQPGALTKEILLDYVGQRNECRILKNAPNETIFEEMCRALRKIRCGTDAERRQRTGRRQIIVD